MNKFIIAYAAILITYIILDAIWLGVISQSHYQEAIGHLMRKKYPYAPWIIFYVMYCAAIVYLAIYPHHLNTALIPVLINAAVLGMASYGAYNLTCYAILKDWPLNITLMDWAWGIFVTSASATVGFKAMQMFARAH